MKTYTVVTRDLNARDANGAHGISWDCGHKHRSLKTALVCLRKNHDLVGAFGARIERSDWDGHSTPLSTQIYDLVEAQIANL